VPFAILALELGERNHQEKNHQGRKIMEKLSLLWIRYATPRNAKMAYLILGLVALAVAGGAPSGGGGVPG
jgi:hypothetical protein